MSKPRTAEQWRKQREMDRKRQAAKETKTIALIREILDTGYPGGAWRKVAILDAVRSMVRPR